MIIRKAGVVMSDHYFSENPQSKSKPIIWEYTLRGETFKFTSDVGVFSKHGVDFGSRLLIESFVEPEIEGDFLDLGCGYGPIGIALANSFPNRQIIMADVNERSVALAEKNAKANQVENTKVIQSDRFSNIQSHQFAAILINPPIRAGKKVVYHMFEESEQALMSQGELWIVIQKKQGGPSAKDKLESLFGNVDIIARSKGYFIYKAKKI